MIVNNLYFLSFIEKIICIFKLNTFKMYVSKISIKFFIKIVIQKYLAQNIYNN